MLHGLLWIGLPILAIATSKQKAKTFYFIFGWNLAVSVALGVLFFLIGLLAGGNAPALAGDGVAMGTNATPIIASIVAMVRERNRRYKPAPVLEIRRERSWLSRKFW